MRHRDDSVPLPRPLRAAAAALALACIALACAVTSPDAPPVQDAAAAPDGVDLARGVVFEDRDGDGLRDAGEPGVGGVAVSNGREVARTGDDGSWALPIAGDAILFVVKPTGWATPVDPDGLPRFYRLHRPNGSPAGLRYAGIPPTGPLPDSIDFPLRRQPEARPFRVVVFGDPQTRTLDEVDFFAAEIVPQLVGVDAAFGVSLGDIVYDDLILYPALNQAIGRIGIPWYNVPGNHDMNFAAEGDEAAQETFASIFGPPTYAFAYAGVHFIVLDDVILQPLAARQAGSPIYEGGLQPHQLAFLRAYLDGVPRDEPIVLTMHIPLVGPTVHQVPQRDQLFALLGDRPSFSFAAHTHMQTHHFLGPEDGNPGPEHHHLVHGTTCGSWWLGLPDPEGLPFSLMRDGTPQGYSIATFDDDGVRVRYRVSRRPADYQMRIDAPPWVSHADVDTVRVTVNVFAGSERSKVEMRLRPGDPWTPLERSPTLDPFFVAVHERYEAERPEGAPRMLPPEPSSHLWSGPLPLDPGPGTYVIEVRSTDVFGTVDVGRRLMRIE